MSRIGKAQIQIPKGVEIKLTADNVVVVKMFPGISDSVFSAIAFARENARQVRDQITTEMWERLNRLYFLVRDLGMAKGPGRDAFMGRPHEKLAEIIDGLHAFKGATAIVQSMG
jgi:uncharacterized alpha-E superfamily protein